MRDYKGLVFASWDPEAPEFDDYVGDFHWWLDNLADAFDGTEAGTEVFRGVQKWRIKSNWKFVSENFLGDTYHGASTHASVEAVGIGPGGRGKRRHGERQNQGGFSRGRMKTSFRLGHGASDNLDYELAYPEFAESELNDYFVAAWETRAAKLRAEGRPLGGRGPATMFPNMSFSAGFPALDPGRSPAQRHRDRGLAMVPGGQGRPRLRPRSGCGTTTCATPAPAA